MSFCLDIDECIEGISGCGQICKNSNGSYECSCWSGYNLDPDNHNCSGQCLIINI